MARLRSDGQGDNPNSTRTHTEISVHYGDLALGYETGNSTFKDATTFDDVLKGWKRQNLHYYKKTDANIID